MIEIETAVTTTLHAWRRSRFAWSSADCLTGVGDYGLLVKGRDPMAVYRGRYGSEAEGRQFFTNLGFSTLAEVLGRALEAVGFRVVDDPRRGDVVAVDVPGVGLVGSLCLGDRVAFRLARGGCIEAPVPEARFAGVWRP